MSKGCQKHGQTCPCFLQVNFLGSHGAVVCPAELRRNCDHKHAVLARKPVYKALWRRSGSLRRAAVALHSKDVFVYIEILVVDVDIVPDLQRKRSYLHAWIRSVLEFWRQFAAAVCYNFDHWRTPLNIF